MNEIQQQILIAAYNTNRPNIVSGEVAKRFKITRETAVREIRQLSEQEYLEITEETVLSSGGEQGLVLKITTKGREKIRELKNEARNF